MSFQIHSSLFVFPVSQLHSSCMCGVPMWKSYLPCLSWSSVWFQCCCVFCPSLLADTPPTNRKKIPSLHKTSVSPSGYQYDKVVCESTIIELAMRKAWRKLVEANNFCTLLMDILNMTISGNLIGSHCKFWNYEDPRNEHALLFLLILFRIVILISGCWKKH